MRIIVILITSIIASGCAIKRTLVVREEFNIKGIKDLGIIGESYVVYKNKAIGFSGRDLESEQSLQHNLNKSLINNFGKYGFSFYQIPDSLKTKKDMYMIEDDIANIVNYIEDSNDSKNSSIGYMFKTNLAKYGKIQDTPFLVFWNIGGRYSPISTEVLDAMIGVTNIDILNLYFGIVEAATGRVVYYHRINTQLDPNKYKNVEALSLSVLFSILYSEELKPKSFLLLNNPKTRVIVYLKNGQRMKGKITRVDTFEIYLTNEKDGTHQLSLRDISKIKGMRNRYVYYPIK